MENQMKTLALSLFACCVMACTTEGSPGGDGVEETGDHLSTSARAVDRNAPSPVQTIDHEAQAPAVGHQQLQAGLIGTMTGGALRFDGWPSLFGTVNFGFNWSSIHAGSHVFVSASEIDSAGNRFNGAASYTVQNIVVKEGRVEFRIAIDWGSPIRVSTDILTIDP
jgi:hypothetical protein